MSDNRYSVVFTGQLKSNLTAETVISNLVLDLGLAEQKVRELLRRGRVLLKRCDSVSEAQRLAEKFDRSGIICIIEDHFNQAGSSGAGTSGESSLVKLINKFIPSSSRQGDVPASRKG